MAYVAGGGSHSSPPATLPSEGRQTARSEWRNGTGIVLVSTLGFAVSVIHATSLGSLMEPIQGSTGWSRTQITSGMVIISIAGIILTPFLGFMIDRLGVRRIGLAGMALYCAGIASLSLAGSPLSWMGLWIAVGVAEAFINPGLWTVATAQRFSSARGLATAVVLCGGGIAMMTWPPIAEALSSRLGWRATYQAMGLGSALVILPLMLIAFRDVPIATPGASDGIRPKPGLTVAQGLRSTRFHRLAAAGFLMNVGLMGLFVHFVPIVAAASTPRATAVALAGVIGIFSILGRLMSGFLIDRLDGRIVGTISSALPIAGAALLLMGNGVGAAIAAGVLIGLSFGAEIDVVAYLASRHLGLRKFGSLYGFIVSGIVFGSGAGPALASLCYDLTGGYRAFLLASIAIFAVSTACIASLGRYPDFGED